MSKKNEQKNESQVEETKKSAPSVDVGSGQWEDRETVDGETPMEEASWVTPGPGTVIEGQLVRAFVMRDELASESGKKPFRAGYVVKDSNGDEWTFGEKASFARALRHEVTIGTFIRLTFTGKDRLVDPKTGRPTGKTIWRTKLQTMGVGDGPLVLDALKKSHAELLAKGGDVPF